MRIKRTLKTTLAVLLTFALLFGGLFVGVPSSKAADSDWKDSLDPMLTKMKVLEPEEIGFMIDTMGDMVDTLFDQALSNDEKQYLQNNFGLNQDGLQYPVSQFDQRIYSIYGGYDGFLNALDQPRDWTDGGNNLDFLFDQTYLAFPEGFRNQMETKHFDKQKVMNVWLMFFNLKYDRDLAIDPQSMEDIRDYITDNSGITGAELDECGFTLENFQALIDSQGDSEKETFKTVQEKLGNMPGDEPTPKNLVIEKTGGGAVGEPVSFTVTLKDEAENPVPDVNIAVFLVNPNDEEVYFDQQLTDGSGEISGTIDGDIFDIAGAYALYATANAAQGSFGFNVSAIRLTATTTPVSGATSVALNAAVKATFNLDITAVDLSGIKISSSSGTLSGVGASASGKVLTVSHPSFANSTAYTVTIPAGAVRGSNDELNSEIKWSFTTKAASGGGGGGGGGGGSNITEPYVVSTVPVKDAVGVAVDKPISVTFSENIVAGSGFGDIILQDNIGKSVPAAVAISTTNGRILNITPSSSLAYSTLYMVNIPYTSVKDSTNYYLKASYTFSFTTAAEPKATVLSFTDMQGHWALASVTRLVGLGIFSGYPDNTFRPENNITRAELAATLARALNLAPGSEGDLAFSDSADIPAWAKGAVAAVVKEGLLKGYPGEDGTVVFDPQRTVSRVEIASILGRVLEKKVGPVTPAELAFSDADEIPDWARADIGRAVAKGVMSGYPDNTFQGSRMVTRAESASAISKLLDALSVK